MSTPAAQSTLAHSLTSQPISYVFVEAHDRYGAPAEVDFAVFKLTADFAAAVAERSEALVAAHKQLTLGPGPLQMSPTRLSWTVEVPPGFTSWNASGASLHTPVNWELVVDDNHEVVVMALSDAGDFESTGIEVAKLVEYAQNTGVWHHTRKGCGYLLAEGIERVLLSHQNGNEHDHVSGPLLPMLHQAHAALVALDDTVCPLDVPKI